MIALAFWLLTVTVIVGIGMAVRYASRERLMDQRIVPSLHGFLAACGFLALVLALAGGAANVADPYGTSGFGPAAAALAAVALVLGLVVTLRGRTPGRRIGLPIGAHATVAIIAYVLLMAFYWLR